MSSNKPQKEYNSTQTKALTLVANKKQRSDDSLVSNHNLRSRSSSGTSSWSLHGDPLAIDHILEQVLKPLSKSKLRECRSVSPRWNSIITSLSLQDPEQELVVDLSGTKLKELVLLLQDRTSSRPDDILNLAPFPLGVFHFKIPSENRNWKPIAFVEFMNDPITKTFFILHGINIRKLSLIFTTLTTTTAKDRPTEGFLMKEIIHLLTHSVPHLIYLRINIEIRQSKKKGEKKTAHQNDLINQQQQKNQGDNDNHNTIEFKSPIKYFHEWGLPISVFDRILEAAPDLREVDSDSCALYMQLYSLQKMHLLKRLCTYPTQAFHLDILQSISHLCGGDGVNRLKLRELQFRVPEKQHDIGFSKSIDIDSINRILDGSSNCLEILCWDRAAPSHSRLIWPSSLPKVSIICFRAPFGEYRFPIYNGPIMKCRWEELFPNVKNVYFYVVDKRMKAVDFIKSFNLTPWPSVKNVFVRTSKLVPLADVKEISAFFPAAKVTFDPKYHTTFYHIPTK